MSECSRLLHKWLVEWPAAQIDRLTFRKIMVVAGLLLLTIAFSQMFTIDLAFVMAGDALVYFELFAVVTLIAARGRVRLLLYSSRKILQAGAARTFFLLRRGAARAKRTRIARTLAPPKNEDEERLVFA